ncbi:MAG: nucleotide sugar dehydrogenase [Candidatus Omnitrophota bacterium]|nr:nucleotide sugar dehydrogenase [Candidatus Omnitrophota bacterium]
MKKIVTVQRSEVNQGVIPAPVFTGVNSSGNPGYDKMDARFHGHDKNGRRELPEAELLPNISVVGLGKLGLCSAVCFASKGFKVIGVDIDIDKINKINKGISPIDETGLDELLKKVKGSLRATSDYSEAILRTDITFIVVATPSLADGSFSNDYLEKSLHKIGSALRKKKSYHLVVVTSTVMPQTVETVVKFMLEKTSGKICGKDFGIAYNPEFIALGSVLHDFLNPDFLLIGEISKKDGDMLEDIYNRVCENKPRFARMSPLNAEITKIALNCYVTTKITFANSIAAICEKVKGADANVIASALGLDTRIGAKYIRPGLGYGGPCFPRDNVAFSAFARRLEIKAKLAEMVDEVNRDQVTRLIKRVHEILGGFKSDKGKIRIAVLGLSYKPNTPIIEDSQALNITQVLVSEGYRVSVYDPQALENVRGVLGDMVRYAKDADDCIKDADLALIAVPWQEFKKINFRKLSKKVIFLDCWRLLEGVKGINIKYLGAGI